MLIFTMKKPSPFVPYSCEANLKTKSSNHQTWGDGIIVRAKIQIDDDAQMLLTVHFSRQSCLIIPYVLICLSH